ncbi:AGC family protein kinase [Trichomonas vaginalis G3]|uniref:AGC family protein kinase n=1 Tax=Trichomonas vaginalis (strain ATCC PRA-98 / G3) TaxID=412133 RepID=A2FFU9_TRIV3|nr:peptidyl-threonine phosphorylation [Trichomonas vaginalis G3]EAX96210.1 AGC family protein kinase [Trichomonas vaginalis G3]KAI5496657.1 peptidyl-threonine phosphorylation [Trichomonas vaginalis G3]|eukprot:XP_001309140.1 AGC family protein kinase [Trichomonas vaginalis G3]
MNGNLTNVINECAADRQIQIFEWILIKEIGKGSRSNVFLAKNTETNQILAAKIYDKGLLLRQTLENVDPPYVAVQREIEIMAAVDHRYILDAKEVIEDDILNAIIILMSYAERGTLQDMIEAKKFTEDMIPICFFEIAESLRYLHSLNIVHRDIKPENILVFSDTEFVLSDFSVSTALSDENQKLDDTMGSPAFLSPEECDQDSFAPKPADVWAYGVSLYYSVFKKFPFNLDSCHGQNAANTAISVTNLLTTELLTFPEGTDENSDVVRLLKSILNKDPTKRPTFEEIIKDKYFDVALPIDEVNKKKWLDKKKESSVDIINPQAEEEEEEKKSNDAFVI